MGKRLLNIAFYAIAACYGLLMLDLFFRINLISGGRGLSRSYNLIPFGTIWEYLGGEAGVSRSMMMYNIAGNIAVFVPLGAYIQVFLKNKAFGKSLLIAMAVSVSIEVIQFAFGIGAADIDDVMLNVLGGAIGILAYKLLRKLFCDEEKAQTAITVISLLIGTPIIALYFMVLLNRWR